MSKGGETTADFGLVYDDAPETVIAKWKEAGGIQLRSSFIPWHTIQSIKIERDYKPPYHEPGQ